MAMFGNTPRPNNVKENVELSTANTSIARGASLTGDLETVGTIRIEGKIFGNVVSKSKANLGETGYVEGNILAQNAELAGEVKGTVKIVDVLTLKSSAIIHGDIYCGKFVVEPGAKFIGKCDMSQPIKEIKFEARQKATEWSGSSGVGNATKTLAENNDREKAKKASVQ